MATPGGSEKILVVDDKKTILMVYACFLERLGYCVTTTASSLEALAAFKENPHQYDLVITDLTMPDMTGDKLAEEISACRSGIPIILNTGYIDPVTEKSAEAAGIDVTLIKPVSLEELAVTIRRLIDSSPKN